MKEAGTENGKMEYIRWENGAHIHNFKQGSWSFRKRRIQ